MVNIKDINVSSGVETKAGTIYKVTFFDKVIVNDFEERKIVMEATVCETNEGGFIIVDDGGFKEEEILEAVCSANESHYIAFYYDTQKGDFIKEKIKGLKNILKLHDFNNVIDVIKMENNK